MGRIRHVHKVKNVSDEFPEVSRLGEANLSVEDSGPLLRKTEMEEERDMRGFMPTRLEKIVWRQPTQSARGTNYLPTSRRAALNSVVTSPLPIMTSTISNPLLILKRFTLQRHLRLTQHAAFAPSFDDFQSPLRAGCFLTFFLPDRNS